MCAARLEAAGCDVAWARFTPALLGELRGAPPDAVVIDLDRAPSVGRDAALQLRQRRSTRSVRLLFAGAPEGIEQAIGSLPAGARLRRRLGRENDLVLWFPGTRRELERRVAEMRERIGSGGLWIAWAKQASGRATDLTQVVVRRVGLANGLVDYKIIALDATWSALRFRRRER